MGCASPLRRRGPDLVATADPYGAGPPRETELVVATEDRWRRAIVPPSPDAAAVAVLLRMPPTLEGAPPAPGVLLDGRALRLAPAGFVPRHTLFISERLPATAQPRELWLEPPDWMAARRGEITIAAYTWR